MLQLLKQWGRFKKACPLCGHRMVLRLLAVTGPVNALAHSGMQLGFNCWTTSSLSESASGENIVQMANRISGTGMILKLVFHTGSGSRPNSGRQANKIIIKNKNNK